MAVIEKYNVELEEIKVDVAIEGERGRALLYNLSPPKISPATQAFLSEVRKKLITEVAMGPTEILDPNVIEKSKIRFRQTASEILGKEMRLDENSKKILVGILMNDMLGLGDIEFILSDPNLEEVVVSSSKEPIRVYHKSYGWLKTNVTPESEDQIVNYSNIIARRAGRQITTLNPLLDAHIVTGDRANAVLYPISTKGNTITIRKFARDPWTIIDLIKNKTITSEIAALLWLAVQYEMNVLVSGGTASGKTSLLNVMMPFIPPNHRIITIEQTRELQLPSFLYWAPLVTRLPNPEGKGEVSMIDLLVNSLRMRPDRIILGEIRRKEEAEVLFEAMHTGHSVYATVHADTIADTVTRLTNPPISVPPNQMKAVHLGVVMFRDRRKGVRRVYQLGEFIQTEEEGVTKITPNILYRYHPGSDKILPHSKSQVFFDNLTRVTGMDMKEINKDLAEKQGILDNLVKKNIRSIEEVGKAIVEYYMRR